VNYFAATAIEKDMTGRGGSMKVVGELLDENQIRAPPKYEPFDGKSLR